MALSVPSFSWEWGEKKGAFWCKRRGGVIGKVEWKGDVWL